MIPACMAGKHAERCTVCSSCSAKQAKSQELRGNRDYVETAWVSDMGELVEAELLPPAQRGKAAHRDVQTYEGRLRKTSCSSFGMGMKVLSFPRLPCITAQVARQDAQV